MPLLASIHIVCQLHSERKQFDSLLLSMSLMWIKQQKTNK